MSEITIRPLETMDEIIAAEEIQRITWQMPDIEVIPAHMLHATQDSGAALLGAFDGDRLIVLCYNLTHVTIHIPQSK